MILGYHLLVREWAHCRKRSWVAVFDDFLFIFVANDPDAIEREKEYLIDIFY